MEQPWSHWLKSSRSHPVLSPAVPQMRACCRGRPGSQKPHASHRPRDAGPRGTPITAAGPGGAGPPSWMAPGGQVGGRAGPRGGARLTCLTFLPTDELELLLQDGQRRVRAQRSLTEGLSWGPFRGNVQSRASSPGQVEPVRSSSPCIPPARSSAAPGQRPPRGRPLLPREPGLYSSPGASAPPCAVRPERWA